MTNLTRAVDPGRWPHVGPYQVAVPLQMTIFGFYGALLPFGTWGMIGLAFCGLLWALLLGFITARSMRVKEWAKGLANATLFLGILITGLMFGGALMYLPMMLMALNEPSTTYAVLSALMQPSVPFYIILNSIMEMLLVACLLFTNWKLPPKRRALVIAGVLIYFVMRIWTYLVYAELRLDISQHLLSQADVQWFRQTLVVDYRPILVVMTHICFLLAAFVPLDTETRTTVSVREMNAAQTT